jgi:ATP-dependent Clp protease ATP-binding subunit ClpC
VIFGRFTERAQVVLIEAQQESQSFKHGYIGTEHVLLGILKENGYAGQLLTNNGITIDKVKKMTEDYLGFGDDEILTGEMLLTPRAKRLFDDSLDIARKYGHSFINPEHILMALINEGEGVAFTILTSSKADFTLIKQELDKYISGNELRDNERILKEDFEKIKNEWRAHSCTEVQTVDEDDIAKVVSIWTKVPVERLTEKESDKLLHLEDILKKRIVGQEEAIKSLTRAVKRARVGLKNPNRPIGTFIFCGPTGVGKTELCNVLAEVMFGKMSNLIRIDMSEYMEKHSVSRLIGAPPGYVGYEEGGQLSEAVRRKPYSVVLLDEIEKAHPDVFNILLQIMEDGRLTDGKGKVIDFKNTIVIMTSNVGAQKIKNQRKVGFDTSFNANEAEYEKIKDIVLEELKVAFKPEFLNRVDDIIVFNQLKEEDTLKIVNLMLNDTISRLKEKNIDLIYEEDLNKFLINKNKNLEFGARPLRGIINREIVDKLSDELLKGEIKVGDKLKVECKDEILVFSHR